MASPLTLSPEPLSKGCRRVVLALDIATATGYASGPASGRPVFGTWDLGRKRGTTLGEKGAEFMRLLSARIIAEPPAILVIEAPLNIRVLLNIGTTEETVETLYGLVFLARTIAQARGVPEVRAVAVQSVRQHFLGQATFRDGYDPAAKRKIPSREMAKFAVEARCRQIGCAVENDNEADAVALWHYGAAHVCTEAGMRSTPLFRDSSSAREA